MSEQWSEQARRYFEAHAIRPELAAAVGVQERGGKLVYTIKPRDGDPFERTRRPITKQPTIQPPGVKLALWWPFGVPDGQTPERAARRVLALEGEADLLAAFSAVMSKNGDAEARRILLRSDLTLAAIPGTGYPVDRLVDELLAAGAREAYLGFDADESGDRCAVEAAEALKAVGITPLRMPISEGRDLADCLAAAEDGASWLADVLLTADAMAEAVPQNGEKSPPGAKKETSFANPGLLSPSQQWPAPLRPEAFHGPLGRMVRLIEPHSEADPSALLVSALVAFGNLVGRRSDGPGKWVEGTLHACNENAVIVGRTSKARKGTSRGRLMQVFRQVDPEWVLERTGGGLSTGEGLLADVCDRGEQADDAEEAVSSPDKRLLVTEAEFGRVLDVMDRLGNTLSATLRDLYDTGSARVRTRKDPLRTTDAHVSVLAHCSDDELRLKLVEEHQASGFGNRFLFVAAKRARTLPFGGNLTDKDLKPVAEEISVALESAKKAKEVPWGSAAPLWASIYPELSADRPGLFGLLTARAEAHTLRLALIYALADSSRAIEREHLEAALAIWSYCEQTVTYVWGERQENPDAERVRVALMEAGELGLTRTQISDLFDRHRTEAQIEAALSLLQRRLLADETSEPTKGRPVERWRTREREA
jgi:hypothetical protein